MDNIRLNVSLLRRRVPNLTSAARAVGLRPATVSNLCTGKIPIGNAEVRTLIALADLAECSLDELIIRKEKVEIIETGIKVIDLFAPLLDGGTVGLVARPGMGQLVVLGELLNRLKNRGFVSILLKPPGEYLEIKDIHNEIDIIIDSVEDAYETINKLENHTGVILTADRSYVITREIYTLQERLEDIEVNSVTTLLIDLKGEAVELDLPYGPLETLWQFDADLSARMMYPAINPLYSTSTVLEGEFIDQVHITVQQRAKKLLRRYRELRSLINVRGTDGLPKSEIQTYKRGELLEAYLTQPFYVAEDFSGEQGEYVNLQETISDVRKILNGTVDTRKVEDLNFIGKL